MRRSEMIKGIVIILSALSFSSISLGQNILYVSKQTGEKTTFTGTSSYEADEYESGRASLSTTGPITASVSPGLSLDRDQSKKRTIVSSPSLSIGRDQSKTWTGEVTVDVAAAPAPGSSTSASVTGNYTFTYYDYHGPGQDTTVTGFARLHFTIYSIKVDILDITCLCIGEPTQITAQSYQAGGSYQWSVISGNVTLQNSNQSIVTATGNSAGEAKLEVTYYFGLVTTSDTLTLPIIDIEITTTENLEIVQEAPFEIALTASIIPNSRTIGWKVAGPGKYFITWTATQTGGNSIITIKLKHPVPQAWVFDSVIEVTAFDEDCTNCIYADYIPCIDCPYFIDRVSVDLIKFKRNGMTAPGSLPVCITLPRNEFQIGHIFNGNYEGDRNLIAEVSDVIDNNDEQKSPTDIQSASLMLYYRSEYDEARGFYFVPDTIKYSGYISVSGRRIWRWFQISAVGIAGGVSAGVNGDGIELNNNTAGVRNSGFPDFVTLDINNVGGSAGENGGLPVSLTLRGLKQFNERALPSGIYVLAESGDHQAKQQININKLLNIAAGVYLEDLKGYGWILNANSQIIAYPPQDPRICFKPETVMVIDY